MCNDFSIGIEMEGTDFEPFTDIQYQVLEKTIHSLLERYPTLSKQNITGHEHIAPGRKTDPGPFFKWEKLASALDAKLPADVCHESNQSDEGSEGSEGSEVNKDD